MKYDLVFTILGAICFLIAGCFSGNWYNRGAIILVGIANVLFMIR